VGGDVPSAVELVETSQHLEIIKLSAAPQCPDGAVILETIASFKKRQDQRNCGLNPQLSRSPDSAGEGPARPRQPALPVITTLKSLLRSLPFTKTLQDRQGAGIGEGGRWGSPRGACWRSNSPRHRPWRHLNPRALLFSKNIALANLLIFEALVDALRLT